MRKPNNAAARLHRTLGAMLRVHRVAVVTIDPAGRQGLINYKTCRSIKPTEQIASAVCDFAYRWTIYLAGLCVDQSGCRYVKATEIVTNEVYRAEDLSGVIEQTYRAVLNGCNPQHLVGSGWIAIPDAVTIDEAHAYRIFEASGGWNERVHGSVAADHADRLGNGQAGRADNAAGIEAPRRSSQGAA